jgi:hypothetical protein
MTNTSKSLCTPRSLPHPSAITASMPACGAAPLTASRKALKAEVDRFRVTALFP